MTRLTTRELMNRTDAPIIDYEGAGRPFLRAITYPAVVRVILWPHTDINLGGVGMTFDIPTCDLDLPMWDVI
jgi:hypothetical protein